MASSFSLETSVSDHIASLTPLGPDIGPALENAASESRRAVQRARPRRLASVIGAIPGRLRSAVEGASKSSVPPPQQKTYATLERFCIESLSKMTMEGLREGLDRRLSALRSERARLENLKADAPAGLRDHERLSDVANREALDAANSLAVRYWWALPLLFLILGSIGLATVSFLPGLGIAGFVSYWRWLTFLPLTLVLPVGISLFAIVRARRKARAAVDAIISRERERSAITLAPARLVWINQIEPAVTATLATISGATQELHAGCDEARNRQRALASKDTGLFQTVVPTDAELRREAKRIATNRLDGMVRQVVLQGEISKVAQAAASVASETVRQASQLPTNLREYLVQSSDRLSFLQELDRRSAPLAHVDPTVDRQRDRFDLRVIQIDGARTNPMADQISQQNLRAVADSRLVDNRDPCKIVAISEERLLSLAQLSSYRAAVAHTGTPSKEDLKTRWVSIAPDRLLAAGRNNSQSRPAMIRLLGRLAAHGLLARSANTYRITNPRLAAQINRPGGVLTDSGFERLVQSVLETPDLRQALKTGLDDHVEAIGDWRKDRELVDAIQGGLTMWPQEFRQELESALMEDLGPAGILALEAAALSKADSRGVATDSRSNSSLGPTNGSAHRVSR